ncbi:MAG: DUF423 domain-containing protein [Parachlamydiaceae bacterium]
MEIKLFVTLGTLLGAIGVAIGAIGAHLLKDKLSLDQLQVMEIGVRYQMYHALALIALACALSYFNHEWLRFALGCMFVGTVLFSGSLYLYALTSIRYFAFITPIGGTLLVLSWIIYTLGLVKT